MNKQITIQITRDDLFQMIEEKGGIAIPSGVAVRGGLTSTSWLSEIEFPIVIQWEETAHPIFSLSFRFPGLRQAEIAGLADANRKIEAIKLVRSLTGWTLKDAKGWIDHNFPE